MALKIRKIGITSIGDMGGQVAVRLKKAGYEIFTSLEGRSKRTQALTVKAGVTDCGSIEKLVASVDVIISVLDPAHAVSKAREVAAAIKATGKKIMFVNGNAVAPRTAQEIDGIIRAEGGSCIDGSILRVTTREGKSELRLYVSGPEAAELTQINDEILKIRVVGEKVGNASALKMCYGAFTKGALALGVELLLASHKLGVADEVAAEFEDTQPEVYKWILGRTIGMAPKAYRYVPEMLEVATTFEDAGMTRRMLEGAADMFEMLAKTPLAKETPEESKEKGRKGKEIIKALAEGKA
ncbi:MAG: 6-phosphogluconate dehydrogenase, NAD-binding [Betaproteobacteria bacterium]|nr:6-phosphogluconate dehydrogenase, NAD-binding [Betaproteobacteria bacterium]